MTGSGGYSRTAERLTPRQRDVLACAASGRTITATALELGIAEGTVRTIRSSVVVRAHAHTFTEAVYLFGRGELR
jgi:DNA-binding NarL/FixJ family response regulator